MDSNDYMNKTIPCYAKDLQVGDKFLCLHSRSKICTVDKVTDFLVRFCVENGHVTFAIYFDDVVLKFKE